MDYELSADRLRRTVEPEVLGIPSTQHLTPVKDIIGQKRAVTALRFGLSIQEGGFNIYVSGPPGIGKMTAVQAFLEELARPEETSPDWCYVNNFDDPYQPKVFRLATGQGRHLQADMKNLIEHVRHELPKAFESEEYGTKRDEIVKKLNREREVVLERVSEKASQAGFTLQATPLGIVMVPLLGGRPLDESQLAALPASAREDLQRRRESLQEELKTASKQVGELERTIRQKLQELDRGVALYVVGGLMGDLRERYKDSSDVSIFLEAVQKDIIENIEMFKSSGTSPLPQSPETAASPSPWLRELPFRKYQVNVFVDNSQQEGTPVVVELNPSYTNLFGRIEKEPQFGSLYTDFTLIKAGSIHRANGGYLVLPVEDVLKNFFSWDGLKRALRTREITIEELGERMGFLVTKSLRPQPIPLRLKVVLVGRPLLYYLLHAYDEDFPELFKVKADFDTSMPLNAENTQDFLTFLGVFCNKENLRHLDAGAAARLLEHSFRLAEDQEKISTHFGALADVIREAHHWAAQEASVYINRAHILKALDAKVHRSNLIQERLQEMVTRGTLLIVTSGEVVGQVNGLSVIGLGDYYFGKPSRITVTVAPGRSGIVDIEREVELGGPIHSKGVLILSGYLPQKYTLEKPLSLSARVVFEQSYEGVEGDSASSTELYALLSGLSRLPVKQSIAVTGSVNQLGEVQAIGGVNEKIEGFFDVCNAKGLTGDQGVIIPQSNCRNLMLREDVLEATRRRQFHIWAVKTIDEGIEILTGFPAGSRGQDGLFPEGSVNSRVEQRLRQFAESLKDSSGKNQPESTP